MSLDSSALAAILLDEPAAPDISTAIHFAPSSSMAAPNWLETSMAFSGRMTRASFARLEAVVGPLNNMIVPFDAAKAVIAGGTNLQFGKKSHPAKLNFGDCRVHALAKQTRKPLLFKGRDFAQTDITPALAA